MEPKKILVVGSLVEDLISQANVFPNSGETRLGGGFSKAPGGKGANQAVQAARLGMKVDFFGMTGDDCFARELVTAVRDSGIVTTKIARAKDTSSGASAVTIENIDGVKCNRILMNPGSNFELTIDDVRFLEKEIDGYSCLVLQFEIPLAVDEYLATLAHKHGVMVIVNPAPSQKISDSFLANIDYLTPNEHEASDLSGVAIANDGHNVSDSDITKCSKILLNKGVKNLIITLGGAGSVLINDKEVISNPAIANVKVVDPTAAGDSFVGAFASGIVSGLSEKEALRLASYVSALTVQKMGALPSLPNLQETLDYMAGHGEEGLVAKVRAAFPAPRTLEDDFAFFKETIRSEFLASLDRMKIEDYESALALIAHAEANGGRVHITGIGKPSHVAEYGASLLSSTGTPTYFLHGTEAVHGSCGQLLPGDVVIAISNSGETSELKATVTAIKKNGCHIVGISGSPTSWLAKESDAFILAHADQEGGPLNKAPRASINSEMLVIQALSTLLQSKKRISPEQYVMWHPGGKLGESLKNVK